MHNEASEFTNKENIMKERLKDVFLITPIFLMIKLVRPIMPDDNPLKTATYQDYKKHRTKLSDMFGLYFSLNIIIIFASIPLVIKHLF